MKKLTFLTALILCFSFCFGVVYAEEVITYEEAAVVLSKLGVMEADDSIENDAMCTRGEFAIAVANALKINEVDETRFFDVSRDMEGFGKISALYDAGIISGDGEGNYHPERVITGTEACCLMMGATGHTRFFTGADGKVEKSLSFAHDLDVLTNDMSMGDVSMKQAVEMIYRMMFVNGLTPVGTGQWGSTEYADVGKSMMSMYHKVGSFTGYVDGVYGTSLKTGATLKENQISIDGVAYALDYNVNPTDILGKTMKVVYTYENNIQEKTIIFLGDYDNRLDEIKISDQQYRGFNEKSYVMTYRTSTTTNSEKTLNIDKSAYIIYNGENVGKNINKLMASLNGDLDNLEITLRDADDDGSYELVLIDKYENLVVNSVDKTKKILYGEKANGKIATIELDVNYLSILSQDGEKLDIDQISKDAIVSVYHSDDHVRIYSSVSSITGVITSTKLKRVIVLDDKEYKVDGELWANGGKTALLNATYEAKIDAFGKIARLEKDKISDKTWGYIISSDIDDSDEKITLKILSEDGVIADYPLYKNVKIDGVLMKGAELKVILSRIGETFDSGKPKPQIIRFILNANNEIRNLDTCISTKYEEQNDEISKTVDKAEVYFSSIKRFGFKTLIGNDTVVFRVPEIDEKGYLVNASGTGLDNMRPRPEDYAVISNPFVNGGHYAVQGYVADKKNPVQDVVVYTVNAFNELGGDTPTLAMVSSFSQRLNSEGDSVTALHVMTAGGEKIYYAMNDGVLKNISIGDLIEVSADLNDNVAEIKVYYDYSEDKVVDWNTENVYKAEKYYYGQPQITCGYAIGMYEGVLKIGYGQTETTDEALDLGATSALIFDKSMPDDYKIYTGGAGDITTFEQVGAACSKVFILSNATQFRGVFVYK